MNKSLPNADLESKENIRIDDLVKLRKEFKNLQLKFNEEREKNVNLEKKNISLENELNETKKLKNCPRCRFPAALTDIKQLFVEEAGDSSDDSSGEFTESKSQIDFVKIKNKWKEIDSGYSMCCTNNCINTENPSGNCVKGYGYGKLIDGENINYINCLEGKCFDQYILVYAENSFKAPQNSLNYSLYYFEVKCKFEREKSSVWMNIGLKNLNTNKYIYYYANNAKIYNEKDEAFNVSITWKNNDYFGCGLVYPPSNMTDKFPYVFFTQNGKEIGEEILLKDNSESYKPFVWLKSHSVEANFGNNLEEKPFKYDISDHLILK
uniref:Uncharacterized protein n=1 Tax=Meloidogyne enterolobii TaxID=390850 RepID=A0A6V7XLX3_MELEN|nr:unnamed protein product [Meloidogyne enterolobii]